MSFTFPVVGAPPSLPHLPLSAYVTTITGRLAKKCPAEEKEEDVFVSALLEWSKIYFSSGTQHTDLLSFLNGVGADASPSSAAPREENLRVLTIGEKRKLASCLANAKTDNSILFHVFSPRCQRTSEVVRRVFQLEGNELGHQTNGHKITSEDELYVHNFLVKIGVSLYSPAHRHASTCQSSLLYGELLPSAVTKMLGGERLDAARAEVFFDLGMGLGKCAVQAFVAFPNLTKVVGVELAPSRAKQAMEASFHLALAVDTVLPPDAVLPILQDLETAAMSFVKGQHKTRLTLKESNRFLELRQQNLFDATDAFEADIVVMETHFPIGIRKALCKFLQNLKPGARLLSYDDWEQVFAEEAMPCTFERLPCNKSPEDRYFTTWAFKFGHHFHLWRKL